MLAKAVISILLFSSLSFAQSSGFGYFGKVKCDTTIRCDTLETDTSTGFCFKQAVLMLDTGAIDWADSTQPKTIYKSIDILQLVKLNVITTSVKGKYLDTYNKRSFSEDFKKEYTGQINYKYYLPMFYKVDTIKVDYER